MRHLNSQRLGASVVALLAGLAWIGSAGAQDQVPTSPQVNLGVLTGMVARCVNGNEVPASGIAIGIQGQSDALARSDANGEFTVGLPAGTYTVTATASDGSATRPNVPVQLGTYLDIGTLDIGTGLAACGADVSAPAPAPAQATPAATPAPVAPTLEPTVAPPPPTATPAAVQPDATPSGATSPDATPGAASPDDSAPPDAASGD